MILVDANLLIYAVDRDSPQHAQARRWLEAALSGTEQIGIPWIVALAFVRITTHPRIMRSPIDTMTALDYIDAWLRQPHVKLIGPGDTHWPILRNLLAVSGAAGNLTSDAHLAALAIEHGATVASADNDFRRFNGVNHINPLARQGKKRRLGMLDGKLTIPDDFNDPLPDEVIEIFEGRPR